jgi:hypothetical protein
MDRTPRRRAAGRDELRPHPGPLRARSEPTSGGRLGTAARPLLCLRGGADPLSPYHRPLPRPAERDRATIVPAADRRRQRPGPDAGGRLVRVPRGRRVSREQRDPSPFYPPAGWLSARRAAALRDRRRGASRGAGWADHSPPPDRRAPTRRTGRAAPPGTDRTCAARHPRPVHLAVATAAAIRARSASSGWNRPTSEHPVTRTTTSAHSGRDTNSRKVGCLAR